MINYLYISILIRLNLIKMKPLVFTALVFLTSLNSISQEPALLWERAYGGTQDEELNSLIKLSNGNFLVGASTESHNGDIQSGNFQSMDIWVYEISPSGEIIWEKTYGGSDSDYCYSVLQDTDSTFMVAGMTSSSDGDINSEFKGERDLWFFRINQENDIIWEKTMGGSKLEEGSVLIKANDGEILVGANTNSSDGDVEYPNKGNYDYWVFKYDSAGEIKWQKTYGGSGRDVLYDLCCSPDSGYLLCGYTRSNDGDIQSGNEGDYDIWLVKIDNEGNLLWERTYGGSSYDAPRQVLPLTDGYLIAGYTDSDNVDIQSGNHGQRDVWVLKIDKDGKLLWEKTYGGLGIDYLNSAVQAENGEFILGCTSESDDGDHSYPNYGELDIWVVGINSSGDITFDKKSGGSELDVCTAVVVNDLNSLMIGGYTFSNNLDIQSGNHGGKDNWIFQLQLDGVIDNLENVSYDYCFVHPNPAKEYIRITSEKNSFEACFSIFNSNGRLMLKRKVSGNEDINIQSLQPGLYLYKIDEGNKTITGKVIIE